MKSIAKKSLLIFTLFFVSTTVYAQNRPTEYNVGLTASIQSSQTNLKVPIWLADNVTIAPIFGLTHQENAFTSLNLGISSRFYQDLGNDFASYIGAQGLLLRTSSDAGPENTDYLLGATGGGEYFIDDHFSMGVQGQLNFSIDDGGSNEISTGADNFGHLLFLINSLIP